jgi:hypothetical protein
VEPFRRRVCALLSALTTNNGNDSSEARTKHDADERWGSLDQRLSYGLLVALGTHLEAWLDVG